MKYQRKTVPMWKYDAYRLWSITLVLIVGVMGFNNVIQAQIERMDEDYRASIRNPVVNITQHEIEVVTKYVVPETIEDKIRARFGDEAEVALKVAFCESSMNPKAKNSTSSARGLFQIMQSWHKINEKWLLNEDINIEVAYQLWSEQGWTPWEASAHCWRGK